MTLLALKKIVLFATVALVKNQCSCYVKIKLQKWATPCLNQKYLHMLRIVFLSVKSR